MPPGAPLTLTSEHENGNVVMRTRWPVLALVAALSVLTGCGDDTTGEGRDEPVRAVTSAARTPEAATGAGDAPRTATPAAPDGFVDVVRARVPEVAAGRRAEEIQAIAYTACADLAAGRTADEIVATARTLGTLDAEATDHATARELVKLAIDTTCPEQADRVDDF